MLFKPQAGFFLDDDDDDDVDDDENDERRGLALVENARRFIEGV